MRAWPLWIALALLSACAKTPVKPAPPETQADTETAAPSTAPRVARPDQPGDYTAGGLYRPFEADRGPKATPKLGPEPVPKLEPRSRYGNRSPYTVLGRSYRVMDSAQGYVQRGEASWYGEKFHGRATSSLEPYDMYAYSAAHKTLPLPTYARVTHLRNGRSVVVRVNDRGPFHGDRLIDLSYAAAVKLGMHDHGVALVEVRALTPGEAVSVVQAPLERHPASAIRRPAASAAARPASRSVERTQTPSPSRPAQASPEATRQTWIQVASFGDRDNAERLAARLQDAQFERVKIQRAEVRGDAVYRVRLGPVAGRALAERLAAKVRALGLGQPAFVPE